MGLKCVSCVTTRWDPAMQPGGWVLAFPQRCRQPGGRMGCDMQAPPGTRQALTRRHKGLLPGCASSEAIATVGGTGSRRVLSPAQRPRPLCASAQERPRAAATAWPCSGPWGWPCCLCSAPWAPARPAASQVRGPGFTV